eukprot:182364_1
MAQIQQQLTMQNHNKTYASIPYENIHCYEECKNGNGCKSLKYGYCMYKHGINNNNKVKQIINTINTNIGKALNLSNGNITLYQKQLKINNTNMENINNNLEEINKTSNVVNNLE